MAQSPTSSSCQHALLARSPVGQVSLCPDCGVVHLSLDCVSVLLEKTAFVALALMLSQAHKQLNSSQTNQLPGPPVQAQALH